MVCVCVVVCAQHVPMGACVSQLASGAQKISLWSTFSSICHGLVESGFGASRLSE